LNGQPTQPDDQISLDSAWNLPARHGLYDPRFEHDACGIGFVAHVEGRRSHKILEMGLEALGNHAHRGAVADDRKSGDGAGILTQLPYEFFSRELNRMGIETPPMGDLAIGQLYLNKGNGEDRARARDIVKQVLGEFNLEVLAFRSVPVIETALGQRSLQSRPWLGRSSCAVPRQRAKQATPSSDCSTSPASASSTRRAAAPCSVSTFRACPAAPSSTKGSCRPPSWPTFTPT
jgi:glutamate synthase (ferredoxin)